MDNFERKYSTSDKIAFWCFGFVMLYFVCQFLRVIF